MSDGTVIASYLVKVVVRSTDAADEGPKIDAITAAIENAVYAELGEEDRFDVSASAERTDR